MQEGLEKSLKKKLLGREDRSSKRNYPLSVLDTMAGKGASGSAGWNAQRHGNRKARTQWSEVRK